MNGLCEVSSGVCESRHLQQTHFAPGYGPQQGTAHTHAARVLYSMLRAGRRSRAGFSSNALSGAREIFNLLLTREEEKLEGNEFCGPLHFPA